MLESPWKKVKYLNGVLTFNGRTEMYNMEKVKLLSEITFLQSTSHAFPTIEFDIEPFILSQTHPAFAEKEGGGFGLKTNVPISGKTLLGL